MGRYFFDISFRGEPYHGWQIQPGEITVQGVIEEALTRLIRQKISIVGAGRTDAGVNARQMIAHADLPDSFEPNELFVRSLNALVGRDISINSLRPVGPDAHARFDATERTYRYFAHTFKDPFIGKLSWQASSNLNFETMNRAAAMLLGKRDFTSFSKLHTDVKTNICDLRRAEWVQFEAGKWYFEITADRFLRNMVRAVVGTLVEVGRGKIAPENILDILAAQNRCAAGTSMPPDPLFLWQVKY